MSGNLVVVDYRAGNLRSVETALRHLGAGFRVSADPDTVAAAERLIVPGVGEARAAMEVLAAGRLDAAIARVHSSGRPLLGICLGCQIIFELSEERDTRCLGFLAGSVERFPPDSGLKIPHMGWNRVFQRCSHPLFSGIDDGAYFYFVHSFYPDPADASVVIGECDYGVRFAAVVAQDNLAACQFHPEKSAASGLRLLANFLEWSP